MIGAAKELSGVAAGLGGDARALVRAAIVQHLHRVVGVAHHQDRLRADRGAEIVARIRHLAVVADIDPGVGEQMLHFELRTPPRRYRRRGGPRSRGPGLRTASTFPRYLAMSASCPASEIQHQPRRLRPRHADLHHLAGGFLGVRQDEVAMIGHAFDHVDLADAAIAALAIVQRDLCRLRSGHREWSCPAGIRKLLPELFSTTSNDWSPATGRRRGEDFETQPALAQPRSFAPWIAASIIGIGPAANRAARRLSSEAIRPRRRRCPAMSSV